MSVSSLRTDGNTRLSNTRLILSALLLLHPSQQFVLKPVTTRLLKPRASSRCSPLTRARVMHTRACRILEEPSASSRSQVGQAPHQRTTPNRLPIERLVASWKRLMLKTSLIFQMIAQRSKVKMLLGPAVYNAWFTPAVQESTSQSSQPTVSRVIKGQAVGRQLARGAGVKDLENVRMDPEMCQHPEEHMAHRGNKTSHWWICKKCASRWERMDFAQVNPSADPLDDDLATFGKHMGKTYAQIYASDPGYCEWVMQTVSQGESANAPALERLAHFIHTKQTAETFAADGWAEMDQL